MTRFRRPALWQTYLAVGALLTALYAFVPPFAGSGPLMNVIGLSPVVAIVVGVRKHRPASSGPWGWFAVGLALFWLGDLYTIGYPRLFGAEVPFPSIGDGAYIAMYPAMMAGLLGLIRRRNPDGDRAGLIDSLIMTLGLSLLSWVMLIAPYLVEDEMTLSAKLVSVGYPLGDILLLAAAIRLAVDAGRRQPAFYLLTSSIVALMVTDFAYGLVTLAGTYNDQLSLDLGWIACYVLWGAAALHPSMVGLEQPAADRVPKLGRTRLGLLTLATLIAPGVELLQQMRTGSFDVLVVVGTSGALFALVVLRMAGLVRQQERAVAHERVLSAAGVSLVAATERQDTYRVAVETAASLAGDTGRVLLCRIDPETGELNAYSTEAGWRCPASVGRELLELPIGVPTAVDGALHEALRLPEAHHRAVGLDLTQREGAPCVLLVCDDRPLQPAVMGSLRALATQVTLALETAALNEEIHRRRGEARFGSLVQHSSDLITVLDADATIVYQSPSIEKILGFTPEEVRGERFDRLMQPGEQSRLLHLLADASVTDATETEVLECALRHRDGSVRQFEILHTNLLGDEHVRGIVLNSRDVSERKAFERQLAHQAFHDPVTGLANRALFSERVRHAVARARRDGRGLAVLFMDLDDFKTINDSLGHAAGDKVLVEVAKRLAASIRTSDTAARFGGDEFALLLEDVENVQEAAETAERILAALATPLSLAEKELTARCSLGIAMVEHGTPTDADELIRDADAAMYIAKRDGKGGYRLFEPAMHEGVLARLELRADLQRALTDDQFELYYQPLVHLADGRPSGVEALLRWRHPERGLVSPDDFIPFAEDTGLIVPIGRWVLREGCRQAVAMQRAVPCDPPLSMSINLSVKQLQHSDIVADVREVLEETGLDPTSLTLEITETVMMADADLAVQRLTDLKALGVRLAMDDFGTGYSSLSYLSRFPVDVLKMDRSFLRAGATPEQNGLATAVVALGDTLQLQVVAEGIEYSEQWDTLRGLGCDLGQGFHFARPMDADATLDFLTTTHRDGQAGTPAAAEPLL
jgi:diguanylate cyclase (GGDEF)-like protein/PAS domain S-box-containing protein